MSLLLARIITALIAFLMVVLSFYPVYLASFYLIFRPLIQPFAYLRYTLFGAIPLTGAVSVLLIGTAFLLCVVRREYTLVPPNIFPLYLLVYFSSLSFANSMDFQVSIGHFLKILTGVALYLLVYNVIKSKNDAKKILYAIVIASIVPMLFGYYQYVTGTGHAWKGKAYLTGIRIDSVLGEFNAYGEFLCLSIVAVIMLILWEKQKTIRRLLVGIMSSMVVSLMLSLNRGSWIALTFGLIVGSMFYRRQIKVRWIILTGLIILIFFSSIITQRFQQLEEKALWGRSKNTFSGRIEYWKRIMPLLGEHPVVGFGIGTASMVTVKYLKNDQVPHNDYLRLALETGILSTVCYIFFLIKELIVNIKRTFNNRNWIINYPMLVAIIYFSIISMTQNIIYNVTVFPMMFALIGVARKCNVLNSQHRFK